MFALINLNVKKVGGLVEIPIRLALGIVSGTVIKGQIMLEIIGISLCKCLFLSDNLSHMDFHLDLNRVKWMTSYMVQYLWATSTGVSGFSKPTPRLS